MEDKLIAETSIIIDASKSAVWKAITTPSEIKKYLMGTEVSSDWKEGSQIIYKGEYNGKSYHDKGVIKRILPEKIFESTYWSSMSGIADKPENYKLVTYHLSSKGGKTIVTLIQDNISSQAEKEQMTANWESVLKKLKETVENN